MGLQDCFDILIAIASSYFHDFIQDADTAGLVGQTDEDDLSYGERDVVEVDVEIGRQPSQTSSAAELRRCFEAQGLMGMGFIDGSQQMAQFPSYGSGILERLAQQQGLKPAIEVFHRTISLRLCLRDENWLDP